MKPTGLLALGEDKNDNEHLTRLVREKREKIQRAILGMRGVASV